MITAAKTTMTDVVATCTQHRHTLEIQKQRFVHGGSLGKPHQMPNSTDSRGLTLYYTPRSQRIPAILLQIGWPRQQQQRLKRGKPGFSQQPKIDAVYKNLETHLVLVYEKNVYAQSQCLPKDYLRTQQTTDLLNLNGL